MMKNGSMTNLAFNEVLTEIRRFAVTDQDLRSFQKFSVDLIAQSLPYYDWVGFYMLEPGDENVLVLGHYHGAPTEHARIPVTQGICGAAVARGKTVIVEDVSADPRYLACSLETKYALAGSREGKAPGGEREDCLRRRPL